MRVALFVNDALSVRRNSGLIETLCLPASRILNADETRREFPGVRTAGLMGAARWYDYFMLSSERILIELLRSASAHGALAANYARVERILSDGDSVRGVLVRDELSGQIHTLRARSVVNCAGPWASAHAQDLGHDAAILFKPSLAFNVLLDASLPGNSAYAVSAAGRGAPVLFLVPQRNSVLAGTVHVSRPPGTTEATPSHGEIEDFLAQLRAAIPGFDARMGNVCRVFAGLLPATLEGSAQLVKREVLLDHATKGGLNGMYSVSGVKFTTALDVASQTLKMMGHAEPDRIKPEPLPISSATELLIDAQRLWSHDIAAVREALARTVREEAVHSVEDLVLRRTGWAATEVDLDAVKRQVSALIGDALNKRKLSATPARSGVQG
jgi:glycerol-3-phosphate dehydrogenase